ncbi:putative deoxyribonuclease TATDN1 [Bienertia sinuspersici]
MKQLASQLQSFTVELVPRGENVQADALSILASSTIQDLKRLVFVKVLPGRSTDTNGEYVYQTGPPPQWMVEIIAYKTTGALPSEKTKARKQFDNDDVKEFLTQYHVKFTSSAVCHPQSNGLAEAANKQMLNSLQKRIEDKKGKIHGKLSATWESPYQIYDEVHPGTYKLMDLEGVMLPNNWNADQLKKYFV